ncbi:MAG: peptidoglycan D,D-transpeptidase FtsI family protein [Gammaproteobacteria bacterium]
MNFELTSKYRELIVWFFIFCLLISLPIRFYFLQKNDFDIALDKSKASSERTLKLLSRRGKILDRNLQILAEDIPAYEIGIQINNFSFDPYHILSISKILGINSQNLKNKLSNKKRKYIVLDHNASQDELNKLNIKKIPGLRSISKYKRSYPEGEILSQVIGLTNFNNSGQEGIELSVNKKLSGKDGSKKYVRTNKGEIIETNIIPPDHGQDVRTTLDAKLQYLVYQELKKAFNYYQASSASAILVDLNSKDILAMANYPSFNPNDRRGMNPSLLSNRSATDLFEPGSTVKPLALAGLLKNKTINKNEKIKTSPGFIEYEGFMTSDFKDYGTLNLSEVISKSSNVAMVKLCDRSNSEKIIKNFYQWGFGQYINEIFISNREGYLPSSANLSEREKVSLCYGYGLQVTLIQLVGAYTALFSDGQFEGLNLISDSYNGFENKVISSEIAQEINKMLFEAVNNGTGKRALVNNIKITGKTGTTKRLTNQGYTEKSFNASFIGMAELENKNYVLGILVRDSKENGEGGGQVAAPVFSKIIKSIKNTL